MSHTRTIWEEGRETGFEVVALGAALALTATALDLMTANRIGVLFDICFVLLCVVLALAVRPRDFFTVGVLPPLLMLSLFILVAIAEPAALAEPGVGSVQAVFSGLSHHSVALMVGYLLCLTVLFVRERAEHTRIV